MKLSDVQIPDGSRWPNLSLAKLCGKTIADVEVRLSTEFGEVGLKLKRITFTDGTQLWCEGEHDHPYVTDGTEPILPSSEILDTLNKEEDSL